MHAQECSRYTSSQTTGWLRSGVSCSAFHTRASAVSSANPTIMAMGSGRAGGVAGDAMDPPSP
jgi:hypothetical protein